MPDFSNVFAIHELFKLVESRGNSISDHTAVVVLPEGYGEGMTEELVAEISYYDALGRQVVRESGAG